MGQLIALRWLIIAFAALEPFQFQYYTKGNHFYCLPEVDAKLPTIQVRGHANMKDYQADLHWHNVEMMKTQRYTLLTYQHECSVLKATVLQSSYWSSPTSMGEFRITQFETLFSAM